MILVTLLIGTAAVVLLLPVVADIGCLLAQRRRHRPELPPEAEHPRLLFLVPAHDEQLLIGDCLASFDAHDYPRDRFDVVVIADNCTDATADITRARGYRCLERFDQVQRGKPHAIAWSLEQLPIADYDSIVIVDADSLIDGRFGRRLAAAGELRGKAVQAWHDVSNPTETALTRMAAVFAAGRYRFGFRLKDGAGINVPIMGNGMCFGSDVLRTHGWQAFSICEDWEMYALLTEQGVPIEYVPDLRVYSQEAKSLGQSATQRKRWTAGKLEVLRGLAPRIAASRRIGMLQKLDALAELTAPGPVVLLAGAIMLSVPAWFAPASTWLMAAVWLPVGRQMVYATAGLATVKQPLRTLAAFAFLPFYAVWRLGIQAASFTLLGSQPWIRTRRHAGSTYTTPLGGMESRDG
jgi:1,2-diacylglycerol 3-beta-glucosyltransferase